MKKLALLFVFCPSLALASDTAEIHYSRHFQGELEECGDLVVSGMTDEEVEALRSKFRAGGGKILDLPCKSLGQGPLGVCLATREKQSKRVVIEGRYYTSRAFGADGHEATCKRDLKGKWTTTKAGWAVRARVIKAETRMKRLNSLPQADSSQIGADYDANVVASDGKYKGKTFAVSGTVQKVAKDHRRRIYLQTEGGNQFIGVHLRVTDQKYASSLSPGDKIRLECKGQGQGLLGAATFSCKSPG